MAFNPRKISPLDTKPSVALGIGLPFNQPAVFSSTYFTKDAIKTNLINYFLTNTSERYMNIGFGADLQKFIFEQINNDNLSFLKEDIQYKINKYFPTVVVNSIDISSNPDTNALHVAINYSISNTNMGDKIELIF
jgi:phage baseplate assembly protein W